MKIPPSWNAPHRNKLDRQFYIRKSNGKDPMDVGEMRAVFVSSENLFARIRKFQTDRIDETIHLEIPIPFSEAPRIMLHAIPLSAFRSGTVLNFEGLEYEHTLGPMSGGGSTRYNFDGFLNVGEIGGYPVSYLQIFRQGCIEWVDIDLLTDPKGQRIYSYGAIEPKIIEAIQSSFKFYKKNHVNPPVVYFLTFLDVMGYVLPSRSPRGGQSPPLNREDLFFPDLFVENFEEQPAKIVRPWFDAIWNAFGQPNDPCFNEKGVWEKSI